MPAKTLSERAIAYIALILTASFWGLATVVIKATGEEIPPLTFLMLRFLTSAIILTPAAIFILKRHKINFRRFRHIFSASMIGHVIALILIFMGIERSSAIESSLISSFTPLLVTAMGFIILKETVTRREIEGTLLAFIGTLVIVFSPLALAAGDAEIDTLRLIRSSMLGNLLFLGGITFDSFYSIYTKRFLAGDKVVTPIVQIVFSFIFAAVIFLPLGIGEQILLHKSSNLGQLRTCTINDIDRANYQAGMACDTIGCYECKSCRAAQSPNYFVTADVSKYECLLATQSPTLTSVIIGNVQKYLSPPILYGILYMSLISGIAGYILYQYGLKYIEASEAVTFHYLQPLFTIPTAMIFLNEKVSYMFVAGALIIMVGVYLAEKRK